MIFEDKSEGEDMKKNWISAKQIVVFTMAFGMLFLGVQSCKKAPPSSDQSDSLGIAASDGQPSFSPDGTRIVFVSDRNGNNEIYTMNTDGSDVARLNFNSDQDFHPNWSPDGRRIVFYTNRDGNGEIYTMNVDGSNQTRLTDHPAADDMPTWSPDGSKIAFASSRDGNWEIYIMNTDGSNQTRLTDHPDGDIWPSWSPDGSKIIFVSNRDKNQEIYTMNPDGSEQTRLIEEPSREAYPSWSPDGRKIVFASDREGNPEIYTMNPDGTGQTRLTENTVYDAQATWSPDSQRIVFVSNRDFNEEIYVMDADGSNPVRLTNNAPRNVAVGRAPVPQSELNLEEIAYKIVYESWRVIDGKENGEICLVDADGSNFVNLTNTPDIDEEVPHVSPDGRQVCFHAIEGEEENKSRNAYVMNIDGTGRVKIADNAAFPFWSPDGRSIAYLPGEYPRFSPDARSTKGLVIYDLETGETRTSPNDRIMNLYSPSWSMDGEWIVVGSRAFKIDDKTVLWLPLEGCSQDISPDGKRLVWNGTDFNLNIGRLDLDSEDHRVTDHTIVVASEYPYWVYHADWSPDGNYLAFRYGIPERYVRAGEPEVPFQICVCDLRTGKWTQITFDGTFNDEPEWVPLK